MSQAELKCPYCGQPARLTTGAEIYPHRADLHILRFWMCTPCGAYVGCHKGGTGTQPLGTLANAELRAKRNLAHAMFDPLWKSKKITRSQAYAWLAKKLGKPIEKTHIGSSTLDECEQILAACKEYPR